MVKTIAIGHLGRDCTINTVNGKQVINFSVAHSEKYKDNRGNNVEKTLWIDCSYWNEKVGIAPYLKKGTQVYVEGVPDVVTYDGKDGTKIAAFRLRVSSVQLLGSKKDGDGHAAAAPAAAGGSYEPVGDAAGDDDLPF